MNQKIFTIKDIVEQKFFGNLSRRALNNYFTKGILNGRRIGKKWTITAQELDEYFTKK